MVLLLASLIAVAGVFELDIVLAAFAAGFILRMAIPDGNHLLESKMGAWRSACWCRCSS